MIVVHCKKHSYTHYIGRPSIFGNPFIVGVHGSRKEVIDKYLEYVIDNQEVLNAIYNLPPDAILGCWCKPLICHGDVIVDIYKLLKNYI